MSPAPPRGDAIATAAMYAVSLEARGEHFAAESVSRNLDLDLGWPEGATITMVRGLLGTECADVGPFDDAPCSTPYCERMADGIDSTVCPECAENLERVEAMIACQPVPPEAS